MRVVERVAALTAQLDVAMRVADFAIRGRTMFPPLVGLQLEDSLLDAWAEQMREMSAKLKVDGVVGDDVAVEVVTGNGWDQALDAVEWEDGDLLALGTTTRRTIKGVFLGSHGAKIIRFSPVPVLVLPSYRLAVPRSTAICEPEMVADPSPASQATTSDLFGRHEFLQTLLTCVVHRVIRHRREAVQVARVFREDRHHGLTLDHGSVDRVRMDRIDPNPELAQLQSERIGDGDQTVFRRRVVAVARRGLQILPTS